MKFCPSCLNDYPDIETQCPIDKKPLLTLINDYPENISDSVGKVLEKRYKIISLIGKGGMGSVLMAEHLFLEREVAIKVLKPELSLIPEIKKRFLREARAISLIRHKNIVEILDFGVTNYGLYYIVMEYLNGVDLYSHITKNNKLSVNEATNISIQIADALSEVHKAGFIHRDLKPENIVLINEEEGKFFAKLLDFGIAKIFEGEKKGEERLTSAGGTLGSPYYMSPEQVQGLELSPASDIYSLGCMMYEMLGGTPPFTGNGASEIMTQHLSSYPVPITEINSEVPLSLQSIINKCLQKKKDERYNNCNELINDLIKIQETDGHFLTLPDTMSDVDYGRVDKFKIETERGKKYNFVHIGILSVLIIIFFATIAYVIRSAKLKENIPSRPLKVQPTLIPKLPELNLSEKKLILPKDVKEDLKKEKQVQIFIATIPEGASVFHKNFFIGKTPLTLKEIESKEKKEIEIVLEDFQPRKIEIPLTNDQNIEIALEKIQKQKKKGRKIKIPDELLVP